MVVATLLIVLPLGVGAAIYLTEYASNRRLAGMIEYAAETLSGIPSIIYGLVGMLFFCQFLDMQTSLLAGALTLVIMNLPTIMRTTQESLKTVPQSYREGAFGLGAGKWRVIHTVVLPGCVDGVITGCILTVGRILGESAALLFTAGFAHALNGLLRGTGQRGRDAHGGAVCVRQGAGRIRRGLRHCGDTDGADAYNQSGGGCWWGATLSGAENSIVRRIMDNMSDIISVKDHVPVVRAAPGAEGREHRDSREEHHGADRPLGLRQIDLSEDAEPHERSGAGRAASPAV